MQNMKTYKNPVCRGADPFVILHNGIYYLYATSAPSEGFKVYASENLVSWEDKGMCLKKEDVMGENNFWAPEVMFYGGLFYMIYTSECHLGIAVADSPLGPFVQKEKKWLIDGQAIDGHFFIDDDNVYLYYNPWDVNKIAGVKMNADMLSVDESTRKNLITPGELDWEESEKNVKICEGPFVIKHNGYYYLSYSCNDYRNIDYCLGCAVSDSPLGNFRKFDRPILKKSDKIVGTGHHSFTTTKDGNSYICVYHCHGSTEEIEPRMVCIDKVEFVLGENGIDIPRVVGPTAEERPILV